MQNMLLCSNLFLLSVLVVLPLSCVVIMETKCHSKKCCVPNCEDNTSKRHRFPKSDENLLKVWIEQIKNPLFVKKSFEQIYKTYYVCDRHFPNEFKLFSKRGLFAKAYPTLFLPESSRSNVEENVIPTKRMKRASVEDVPAEIYSEQPCLTITPSTSGIMNIMETPNTPSMRSDVDHCEHASRISPKHKRCLSLGVGIKRRKILQEVHVNRQNEMTPKARQMYKKVINWGNKIARLQSNVNTYKLRLESAEKLACGPNFDNLLKYVNKPTYYFIQSQIRNQKHSGKGRRFTLDEKILALSLFKASGRGYRTMSKIFVLPSKKTLTRLLMKVRLHPGLNQMLFDNLKESTLKMTAAEKCCILVFDEMSIACNVQYNRRDDCIEGVQDTGGSMHSPDLADHVLVFMLRGVYKQWKQPISFCFTSGPVKSLILKSLIREAIIASQDAGFNIVATVCDQSGPNCAAINGLIKDTKEDCMRQGIENQFLGFLISNREIIPLYDVPHLFKGLRNNLLTKNLHFTVDGKKMVAKWEHIEQFYRLDTSEEERICPKLTDQHVIKDKIKKMKVSCCMQVFSHQVGSLMKRIALWNIEAEHKLEKEATNTAELILFLDELFDSLNSNNQLSPSGKPLKGAVKQNSPHAEYWRNALSILKNMKYFSRKKQKLISVPSIRNLIFTIRGFLRLTNILFSQHKFNYILIRPFNQDALEIFFSYVRSHGVRHVSPDVSHFQTSFKALLLNNFLSAHSPNANCEEDFSTGALNNMRSFLLMEQETHLPTSSYISPPPIPSNVILNRRTRVGQCTLVYISGYLVRKLMKSLKCDSCKNNLQYWNEHLSNDFIEARQYPTSKLVKPGSFFYYLVSQSFSHLYYLIPRMCHIRNITNVLENILMEKVDFKPINCPSHDMGTNIICKLAVKCSLYFWCKRVNKIAKGKDSKFIFYMKQQHDPSLIDPMKLKAHHKFLKKSKTKRAK